MAWADSYRFDIDWTAQVTTEMEYDNTLDFFDEDQREEYEKAFQSQLLKHGATFLQNLMESLRSGEDIEDGDSNDFEKNDAEIFEMLIEAFHSRKRLLSLWDLEKLGMNEELIYRIGQISLYRIGQISFLDQQEEQGLLFHKFSNTILLIDLLEPNDFIDEEALNCERIDSDSEEDMDNDRYIKIMRYLFSLLATDTKFMHRKSGSKCDRAAKESDDNEKTFDRLQISSPYCISLLVTKIKLIHSSSSPKYSEESDETYSRKSAKSDDLEKTVNVFDHW